MRLYPYQEEGVQFLMSRPKKLKCKNRKLLADDMGLGKTVQAIEAARRLGYKTALIVCPAGVKYNWPRQIQKWGWDNGEKTFVISDTRSRIPDDSTILVVNYDLLRYKPIKDQLDQRRFDVGIFDEAHRIKTMGANRTKSVLGKNGLARRCKTKWYLTGTPIPNRPIEAYMILQANVPWLIEPYNSWRAFGMQFCQGRHCYRGERGERDPQNPSEQYNFKGASNVRDLRKRLKPFMLRRKLSHVFRQLPPIIEESIYLNVDIMQHPEVIEQRENGLVRRTEEFDPAKELPGTTLRRIIAESKIPDAFTFVDDAVQTIEKVVVFTYHRNVTEGLETLLQDKGYKPVALYGGISSKKKQKLIDTFIEDPQTRVFISQIVAGGEGIDGLQEVCKHVIFAEIDWSAGGMAQARARLHRIGQKDRVTVQYLLADNTIETVMADVLERKNTVIRQLIENKEPVKMALEDLLKQLVDNTDRIATALECSATMAVPAKKLEVVKDEPKAKASAILDEDDEDDEDDKPAKKEKKKDKKAAKSKEITKKDLKDLCVEFVNTGDNDKDTAKKLIKKTCGVKTLAEVDEADYEKLYKALEKGIADSKDSDDDEEDDDE